MRLSDAMRLGAALRPQAFGHLHRHHVREGQTTCAMGAAAEAIGLLRFDETGAALQTTDQSIDHSLRRVWPWLLKQQCHCGVCPVTGMALAVILHLNDHHRWTREAIAQWVAGIEREIGYEERTVPTPDLVEA